MSKGEYQDLSECKKQIVDTVSKNDKKLVIQSLVNGRMLAFEEMLKKINEGCTLEELKEYSELQIRAKKDLEIVANKE